MEVDGGDDASLMAAVPMPPEGRLQVAWGPGNQLLLAAMPSINSEDANELPIAASTVRWCGKICTDPLTPTDGAALDALDVRQLTGDSERVMQG